jgi:siroheme decarboxylase
MAATAKMAQGPHTAEPAIDAIDRWIIAATQSGLPRVREPYHLIAADLDLDPTLVMHRLTRMLQAGIIRRIAAVPNHYAVGYTANGMSVWDVADAHVHELGRQVGALPFVSHAYHRPRHLPVWSYNLFAMVHGRSREEVGQQVARIAELLGGACRAQDVLYSTRILKKTGMRINV